MELVVEPQCIMSSSGEPSETRQRLDRIRRRSTSSDRSAPAQNGKKAKTTEESNQSNEKNNEDGSRPNEDPVASSRSVSLVLERRILGSTDWPLAPEVQGMSQVEAKGMW